MARFANRPQNPPGIREPRGQANEPRKTNSSNVELEENGVLTIVGDRPGSADVPPTLDLGARASRPLVSPPARIPADVPPTLDLGARASRPLVFPPTSRPLVSPPARIPADVPPTLDLGARASRPLVSPPARIPARAPRSGVAYPRRHSPRSSIKLLIPKTISATR